MWDCSPKMIRSPGHIGFSPGSLFPGIADEIAWPAAGMLCFFDRLTGGEQKKRGPKRPPGSMLTPFSFQLGRITASMTWITPLAQAKSVLTTLASSTFTLPSFTDILAEEPCTVFASDNLTTSFANTLPATTW